MPRPSRAMSGYDPLVFAYVGAAWRHYMYDGLGSTRQLVDWQTQNVTDTYAYEAFGNSMGSSGTTPNPYKYVGSLGYYQTGSSLQHLGARYYMPEIGRFLQRDLIRMGPPYVYAANGPTRYVDPRGLWCILIGIWHHTERHLTWRDPGDWNLRLQETGLVSGVYQCVFWRVWEEQGYYEKWWTKCYLCSCPSLHTECRDTPQRTGFGKKTKKPTTAAPSVLRARRPRRWHAWRS